MILKLKKYKVRISTDSAEINTLQAGDIVNRQYFDGKGTIYTLMYVDSVGVDVVDKDGVKKDSPYFIGQLIYGDEPKTGELLNFVRVTSLSNSARGGALYLTSSDSDSPYMDVIDVVDRDNAVFILSGTGGMAPPNSKVTHIQNTDEYFTEIISDLGVDGLLFSVPNGASKSKRDIVDPVLLGFMSIKPSKDTDMEIFGSTFNLKGGEYNDIFIPLDSSDMMGSHLPMDIHLTNIGSVGDSFYIKGLIFVSMASMTGFSDGVKVRIGQLSGVIDEHFGALDSYGAYFQKLYATKDVNIAGTLSAGSKDGQQAVFYVGKIRTNAFTNSLKIEMKDNPAEKYTYADNPVGIGEMYRSKEDTSFYANKDKLWHLIHAGSTVCFSMFVMSLHEKESVTLNIGDNDIAVKMATNGWNRVYFYFSLPEDAENTVITIRDADVAFCAPQLEFGVHPTIYQPTDEVSLLDYGEGNPDYGMWAAEGGIGGTMQNPLLKLNADGKGAIESKDSGFKLNADGSGHLGGGAISFSKDKVNISLSGTNMGAEVDSINSEIDKAKADAKVANDKIDGLEIGGRNLIQGANNKWTEWTADENTGFIQFGSDTELEDNTDYTFSVEIDKLSDDNNLVSLAVGGSRIKFGYTYDYVWQKYITPKGRSFVTFNTGSKPSERGVFFAWRIRNNKKPMTLRYRGEKLEKGNKATDWTPAPEDQQDELNKQITSVRADFQIKEGQISSTVTKLESSLEESKKEVAKAEQTVKDAESIKTSSEQELKDAKEELKKAQGVALSNTAATGQAKDDAEQAVRDAQKKVEDAQSKVDLAANEAAKAKKEADKALASQNAITIKQTEINQTAEEINLKAVEVNTNATEAKKQAVIADTKATEATSQAELAQVQATEATAKALEADKKAQEALASAGSSSESYKSAKLEAEKANAEATKAKTESDKATAEAAKAKLEADKALSAQADVALKQTEINQTSEAITLTATEVSENSKKAIDASTTATAKANEASANATKAKADAATANTKAIEANKKAEEAKASAGTSSKAYQDAKAEAIKANADATKANAEATKSANEAAKAKLEADKATKASADIALKQTEINQTADSINLKAKEVSSNTTKAEAEAKKAQASATTAQTNATNATNKAKEAQDNAAKTTNDATASAQSKADAQKKADEAKADALKANAEAKKAEADALKAKQEADKAALAQADVVKRHAQIETTAQGVTISAQEAKESADKASKAEASINVKAGEIVMEASSKAADKAIDGLEIGGRNLLPYSELKEYKGGEIYNNLLYSVSSERIIATNQPLNSSLPGWVLYLSGSTQITLSGSTDATKVGFYYRCYNSLGEAVTQQLFFTDSVIGGKFSTTRLLNFPIDTLYVNIGIGDASIRNYWIKPKLELGNKPTDWTPAPEDVVEEAVTKSEAKLIVTANEIRGEVNANKVDADGSISSLNTRVSQTEDKISQTVTKKEYDVNNKQVGEKLTKIEQDADGIKLIAKSAEEKIDDLEIGGRNLLLNSGNFGTTVNNWSSNGGGLVIDTVEKYNGYNTIRTTVGNGIVGSWYKLENGKEYTYSALIKSSEVFTGDYNTPIHYHAGLNNVHQAKIQVLKFDTSYTTSDLGKYKLLYIVFKLTKDADSFRPFIYRGSGTRIFNIAYLKLEKGNKATDWSPAPEDYGASLALTKDGITMMGSGGISLIGKVTFNMMAGADPNDYGTIIEGGTIKTKYLNAQQIVSVGVTADTFKGKNIIVDTGKIGGWKITANTIENTNIILEANGGIRAKNGKWVLAQDGSAKFTSGEIGGWNINNDVLESDSMTLNPLGGISTKTNLWALNADGTAFFGRGIDSVGSHIMDITKTDVVLGGLFHIDKDWIRAYRPGMPPSETYSKGMSLNEVRIGFHKKEPDYLSRAVFGSQALDAASGTNCLIDLEHSSNSSYTGGIRINMTYSEKGWDDTTYPPPAINIISKNTNLSTTAGHQMTGISLNGANIAGFGLRIRIVPSGVSDEKLLDSDSYVMFEGNTNVVYYIPLPSETWVGRVFMVYNNGKKWCQAQCKGKSGTTGIYSSVFRYGDNRKSNRWSLNDGQVGFMINDGRTWNCSYLDWSGSQW